MSGNLKLLEVGESTSEHADTDVGLVHISGCGLNMHETLCGNVDTFTKYTTVNKAVTCLGCKEAYLEIKQSRKRIEFDC